MRALSPRQWPVRWRLAGVSAALTLVILVAFALIVGRLATDRLRSDFRNEVQSAAAELQAGIQIQPTIGGAELRLPDLDELWMANDGAIRIVDSDGEPLADSPTGAPDLGPPRAGVVEVGGYQVASRLVFPSALGGPFFVQYGRSTSSLDQTIGRLWLFLAGGVAGGTLFAALAGLAVAGRAMRPIAALTAAAREIATTRDPSRRLPKPKTRDEVGELAETLDQMLRELDAARGETEQMIQAQREFVADASHELRTPLTSILANLELLQARLEADGARPDAAEESEIVASALGSSRRMRRLVSDLLLLARADAGRPGPRRPCDLAEIAAGAAAEVRPVAGNRVLHVRAEEPVAVEGNPDDLHRLALNLLENGVRHTPAGTEVRIDVARRDGAAVLEVSDDGPGLPEPSGDAIFSRFVRGGGPADRAIDGGTGLGLAIVRAVASSHGGSVEAGHAPQGGARFTVTLPSVDERLLTGRPVAAG